MSLVNLCLLLAERRVVGGIDLGHGGLGLLNAGALRLHLALERTHLAAELLALGVGQAVGLTARLGLFGRSCRGTGVERAGLGARRAHGLALGGSVAQAQVLVHATGHMRQVAVEQRPLLVGHALHQKAVVRHQDQRAGPAVQQVLDNREHVGIQVVARLVQDEHVGLVQNRQQQRQATALAARKIADAAPELLRRKAQALAKLLGRSLLAVDDVVLLIVAEHLADRVAHVGLELLELLRQHAKAHCLANLHAAARGRNFALDHIKQRRLASAILAQKTIAVARTNEPGHVGEYLLGRAVGIGIAGVHVDHIDNLLAQAAHGQALELQLVTHGRHVGDQLASGIHAKLGLGGTSLGTAAQPRELLARHVATALLGNGGHAVALHALQDVCRIAALEGIDLAVVDLPHAGADLVQEPAVVRDHEHGTLAALPAGL